MRGDKGLAREEALRSALERLPVAVLVLDEAQTLRPFNTRAAQLFESEALAGDLLTARPAHPLSQAIRAVVEGESTEAETQILTFPSNRRYSMESSRRSERGRERWLLVLLEPVTTAVVEAEELFETWGLTAREAEIARMIASGEPSDSICRALSISDHTLKTHVRHLLEKSGSRNRVDLLSRLVRAARGD